MAVYTLIIPGRMPGMNEMTVDNRTHRQRGASLKKGWERDIVLLIRQQLRGLKIERPVRMDYIWYERDRRRDKDNISGYGRKIIQDALVTAGVLKNDGWNEIAGFTDDFKVDKRNPRIEITITEVEA